MPTSRDDIARRAYELFLARGSVHGHDVDDWLMAEQQFLAGGHGVLFLPFLRLKQRYSIAGIDFVPLRDGGKIASELSALGSSLLTILSGYTDRHGDAFNDCVVATTKAAGWDLTQNDFDNVAWAASLLFLSSWAENEYLPPFGGHYVNSTTFRTVGQAFTGNSPVYIAVSSRRRDGRTLDGGYRHGEFKFNLPLQVSIRERATVDAELLAALDKAIAAKSETIERLRSALSFVELANTDDDMINSLDAEAILMASAFEQLLAGDASAYKLCKKFGALFGKFGGVTVATAQAARPGIELDADPVRSAAQLKWWVHQKWIEELYDVRSKAVHKGKQSTRKWGWLLHEHLLMSAYVFPLAVKLMLQREGHYTLTDTDEWRCTSVDKLLAATQWDHSDPGEHATKWSSTLADAEREHTSAKVWELMKRLSGP